MVDDESVTTKFVGAVGGSINVVTYIVLESVSPPVLNDDTLYEYSVLSSNPVSVYVVFSSSNSATYTPSLYTLNPSSLSELSYHVNTTDEAVSLLDTKLLGANGGV